MGQLSKLAAVNRILRGAGENPVSSLDDTLVNETLMAETILDEVNMTEQMSGLHCNTVVEELTPDGDGFIFLPDSVLWVQSWYLTQGGKTSLDLNLSTRGNNPTKLYNATDNTDVFEDSVVVKYALLAAFEDLSTATQFQITDQASMLYQMSTVGDNAMNQLLSQMALISRAKGRADNIRSQRANSFVTGRSQGPKQLRRVPRNWW